ncbi:hypothetical protein [Tenacibaculum singaporense]|uniref:Uncharacterized protein n=1 Tax=Tenacibaculum singaporense TaxID=2358479 RepID=A0A3S8R3X2_9FLAO|nr:hypothetical protein [Tenacibaculum singaporense]AZJ34544.1 hypothetical protein D6T69_02960 [Tenacibaculum singaporense]
MSKKPIKSNLFRFVTLRSPQLIEDKETGFVSFPEEKKAESLAFQAIQGATTDEERKTALKGAYSTNFTPIASRVEIKNLHEALYQFSGWLVRNKTVLSYAGIDANLYAAQELTVDEELVLWENLFHQTINKESAIVREGLIQMLVANKFLKAFNVFTNSFSQETEGEIVFTEENEKEFVRRANASVIVPKEVVISDQQFEGGATNISPSSSEYLTSSLQVEMAKTRLQQYELGLKEIEKAEYVYNKSEQVRYKEALQAHELAVEDIKNAAQPTIQTIVDAKSGFEKRLEIYPDLELPKFEFEKAEEISRAADGTTTTTFQYSEGTKDLLNSEGLKLYDNFYEAKTVLRQKIKEENQKILENTPEKVRAISIQGGTLNYNLSKSTPLYSYSGDVFGQIGKGSKIIMFLKVEDSTNVRVTQASYTLDDVDAQVPYTGTSFKSSPASFDDTLLRIELFPGNLEQLISGPVFGLNGSFVLSNGVSLEFKNIMFQVKFDDGYYEITNNFVGQCIVSGNASGDTSTDGKGVLYGISQLGVADFRRVEQEVCCYVPGEVSHIENIMAREYKERSTRDLRVSETTTETTTEKEVENLTDTTSTERNEMQNEASSIVNSDNATSFGANASVSAEFAKTRFSAGANYNNSSSTSASDSNLQAQTYAQEVTERALERVVQKISTKRTSRILREYEENNTHGFDNRKGDKHVTGVYRWVDKIYKNKLINYGKRLMYEFALPEPAKFYIESYLKNGGENEKTPTGFDILGKPVHPSGLRMYAINNSKELNQNNYQYLASIYNAEVETAPVNEIYVSESFKLDSTKTINAYESSSIEGDVKLPEGYESVEVNVSYSGVEDDKAANAKGFFINVGSIKITDRENQPKLHKEVTRTMSGHTGNVAVSATQVDFFTGSLNVVIKCRVDRKGIEKWQNETYKAIIDAYNERLKEYEDLKKSQETEKEPNEKKKELSSQINRSIEKRELKRIAIDLMTKPFDVVTAQDNYKEEGKEVDAKHVVRTSKFQKHAETVKFFEQAFDWEIMAYTFYPYFYGAEGSWDANFEYNEGSDPIFQAFLQSGMARSVVPVRPGFEEAVNWYMKTGEIWNGQGMVTDMDHDLYVSVAEEMQTIEGEVEGTWETRVPTTLTVLQADSVVLNEGGLPCNPDCEGQGLFDVSTYKIGDGPDGVDYDIVGDTNNVA